MAAGYFAIGFGVLLAIVGGLITLTSGHDMVGLMGKGFGLLIFAGGAALAMQGRKLMRRGAESSERDLAMAARTLAQKNGGTVTLEQVAESLSLERELAAAEMRKLVGRGVFDMDFTPEGQQVYKLTSPATPELPAKA